MPLRVALDATPLVGPRTGIGLFCAKVLEVLGTRSDLDVGAFVVSRSGRRSIEGRLPGGVRVLGLPGPGLPARLAHAAWQRWAFPPAGLFTGRADVVHGTNFVVPPSRSAAMVVTVHDLTPWHHPEWCPPAARAYPQLVRTAVARGAWVHADSECVAREVTELLGVPPERVRTVYPGGPARPPAVAGGGGGGGGGGEADGVADGDGERQGSPMPELPGWVTAYVLSVGRVETRKGLPDLVGAFGLFAGAHPGLALVLAGPDGRGAVALDQAIAACPARDRVVRLGWVDDAARDALVKKATVLAYPSLDEGFGLPPLEAMAAGTPVVATDAGALKEVLADAAWLVPVGNRDALAGALARVVEDAGAREELSRKGLERAGLYSWDACGEGLAALYGEVAKSAQVM